MHGRIESNYVVQEVSSGNALLRFMNKSIYKFAQSELQASRNELSESVRQRYWPDITRAIPLDASI